MDLGGTAKKLFVEGDRALVYVSIARTNSTSNDAWMGTKAADCSYGYSCGFSGDGSATQIVIFDMGNRAAPTLLRTIDLPGSLIAARRIGTTVHTVVSIGDLKVPGLETYGSYYCGPDRGRADNGARQDRTVASKQQCQDRCGNLRYWRCGARRRNCPRQARLLGLLP